MLPSEPEGSRSDVGGTSDDGFHEIQLTGKQLVFLFMAVTVVSVVIFLCGVLVGRGVALQRAPAPGPALAAVDDPDAVPPEPPTAMPGPGGAPATASEDLSYPQRLGGAQAVPEPMADLPAPGAVEPPDPAEGEERAAEAGAVEAHASPRGEPAGPGLAVQVAALRDGAEADAVARRLVERGYPAYVIAPAPGAPPVFRVRVGKYADRREAEAVAARLEREEQFKPWIIR